MEQLPLQADWSDKRHPGSVTDTSFEDYAGGALAPLAYSLASTILTFTDNTDLEYFSPGDVVHR